MPVGVWLGGSAQRYFPWRMHPCLEIPKHRIFAATAQLYMYNHRKPSCPKLFAGNNVFMVIRSFIRAVVVPEYQNLTRSPSATSESLKVTIT